jgi:FKBP-type peptidyl-prolyl cis-trans isomerase FkpA
MKYYMLLVLSFLFIVSAKAADKDSIVYYHLPDSVKAVQFMAEIKVTSVAAKHFSVGISTNVGTLEFSEYKGDKRISFFTHRLSQAVTSGNGVNAYRDIKYVYFNFKYNWQLDKTYKLMIALASDSATNICLCSAYVFLPDEKKWKFLGTSRHPFGNTTLKSPYVFIQASKKGFRQVSIGDVWCLRSTGSWKNMKDESLPPPTINLFGHIDSVQQHQTDIKIIEDAIAAGKTDAKEIAEGVYYKMIKEGTGKQVSVNDTVTVFYKLTLLNDGSLVSEAKAKPDTFSLKRLIRGWQIGVPLCKVGGKIKLVIPSDLGYSIRTRSAKIPPNSILVFEIEVLDAKSPL